VGYSGGSRRHNGNGKSGDVVGHWCAGGHLWPTDSHCHPSHKAAFSILENKSALRGAFFTILPLHQVRLDHVLQDDAAHHVKELVVPANSIIEIEIESVAKTTFHDDSWTFGCDGADDAKPYAIERFDRLIDIGKRNWIPGKDEGYSLDRHKYLRIPTDRTRSKGARLQLGLKLQTRAEGVYPANLFFFTDEGTRAAHLTIRVEDRPRTKMKCIAHWGCYVTPMGPQS
jgi:hypothetical protein